MTTLQTEVIANLRDFTEYVESQWKANGDTLWYRGCGRASYELKPSLYRHPHDSVQKLLELESQMLARFKQRSIPYLNRPIMDEWEYLFLMQHFDVPTRLLDWTENPYIALYFSVSAAVGSTEKDKWPCEAAAVWFLDPIAWNRKALDHLSYKGGVLSPGEQQTKGYKPRNISVMDHDPMPKHPIAIFSAHNSSRIVAQRGVFTIFGQSTDPMEEIYEKHGFPPGCLKKILIPSECLVDMYRAVRAIGYKESVIFPGLDGLAAEFQWEFRFRVL